MLHPDGLKEKARTSILVFLLPSSHPRPSKTVLDIQHFAADHLYNRFL